MILLIFHFSFVVELSRKGSLQIVPTCLPRGHATLGTNYIDPFLVWPYVKVCHEINSFAFQFTYAGRSKLFRIMLVRGTRLLR